MKFASEEAVTRLLTAKEILQVDSGFRYISKPDFRNEFDLGSCVKFPQEPEKPSLYGGKYVFIKCSHA